MQRITDSFFLQQMSPHFFILRSVFFVCQLIRPVLLLVVSTAFNNVSMEFVVQVINVSLSSSSNGYDQCIITISDGNYFMDCLPCSSTPVSS
jgi:hypothetical protein